MEDLVALRTLCSPCFWRSCFSLLSGTRRNSVNNKADKLVRPFRFLSFLLSTSESSSSHDTGGRSHALAIWVGDVPRWLCAAGSTDDVKATLKSKLLAALSEKSSLEMAKLYCELLTELGKASKGDDEITSMLKESKATVRSIEIQEMSSELVAAVKAYCKGGPLFDAAWAKADEVEGEEVAEALDDSVNIMLSQLESHLKSGLEGKWCAESMHTCQQTSRLCREVSEACM